MIELKRPTVKVGAKQITQIKEYAYAVAADERFRHLKTRWSFWVISNDLDGFAPRETRQKDKPRGQVSVTQTEDGGQIEVWVKSWSESLRNARLQDHLQANINKENSLTYLKRTYEKYLSGIAIDGEDNDDVERALEEDAAAG